MARLKLPEIGATTTKPTLEQGIAIIGAPAAVPTADEDAGRDKSIEVGDDAEDLGLVPSEPLVTVAATPVPPNDNVPRYGTPLSPRLAADDVAKLEEMARTLLEIRSIAVAASTTSNSLTQRLSTIESAIPTVALRGDLDLLRSTLAEEHQHALELDYEVAMLRSRLDAVDALLQKHGLPTTAQTATTAKKPTITLHSTRRMPHVFPAALEGDTVVLYYNPRQGHDGNDVQEFTVTSAAVRNVGTGYRIDVPTGYVCDVFVGSDVVASAMGCGTVELNVPMRTRGPIQHVAGGVEIGRLALRRVEPMKLEIK